MVSGVYLVNAESDMDPACSCRLGRGRAWHKDNGGPSPEATQFSFSLLVSGAFRAAVPSLELRVSVCE